MNGKSAFEMLGCVVVLLGAILSAECFAINDLHERLAHGRQLKIFLPKTSERLEFIPAGQSVPTDVYWEKDQHRPKRGSVFGSGSDRRWTLDKVTYADEGTYIQKDFWKKEVSSVKVAVTLRYVFTKCVAGDDLSVSLEGIELSDATLRFSGENINITLVRDGAPVGQDHLEYHDRVRPQHNRIDIRVVNTTDVGHYTLVDRRDRVVSIVRMELTDHHDSSGGNPLLALLLLMGIPAGICCCCRKKIFKKKAAYTSTTLQTTPVGGPAGPPPSYQPGPGEPTVFYHGPNTGPAVQPPPAGGQWNGPQPSPGSYPPVNPMYPPVDPGFPPAGPSYPPSGPGYPPAGPGYPPAGPVYPPAGPVYPPAGPVYPPAQPTQWNVPAPGPYQPGAAPMGYAPAMYSAPPGDAAFSAPANAPLLAPQVEAPSAPVPPNPAQPGDSAYMFEVDTGKNNSSNFL
ncbi:unnamed protein product [Boreogadus saida]